MIEGVLSRQFCGFGVCIQCKKIRRVGLDAGNDRSFHNIFSSFRQCNKCLRWSGLPPLSLYLTIYFISVDLGGLISVKCRRFQFEYDGYKYQIHSFHNKRAPFSNKCSPIIESSNAFICLTVKN